MTLLLDTHAFLWWMTEPSRLPLSSRELIADPDSIVLLSAVSAWEIVIKYRLGRLSLPTPPDRLIPEQIAYHSISPLPVDMRHALQVLHLPPHHHDPFDRILIAQAQIESIAIVSGDPMIRQYDVQVLW